MAAQKMSIADVAQIFGVGPTTIHRWVEKRAFPAHRTLGRRLRFDAREIRRYLEEQGAEVPREIAELANR